MTSTTNDPAIQPTWPHVVTACRAVGLNAAGAKPVRIADNAIWTLPGAIIVRITCPCRRAAAHREIITARWLADQAIPAPRPWLPMAVDLPENRAATFWHQLPDHTVGRCKDVATLLRQLHRLPAPGHLPFLVNPAREARARLEADQRSVIIPITDMTWLTSYADDLADAWDSLEDGVAHTPVHGDAWAGNVARTADGQAYLLDLDSVAVGPPEWDLTSTAVKVSTTGTLSLVEYEQFVSAYGGYDVRTYDGFEVMRRVRELLMTTFAIQTAADHPHTTDEARHRIACLRGLNGQRPWTWTAVPHPPGIPSPVV
ncbi:phosphotransferase family protein [Streptomyces sp. NPDC056549]|uniref:phosphotransferase family protein n=1 Tax=Streptomyces sp. NPDC056549 TaxID=3345864 RepID=UPI003694CA0C